jgi:hypothetical protein
MKCQQNLDHHFGLNYINSGLMSKCLVVMQPAFLPWSGYFNLMAQAQDFVFLNNVQLEKQSWQTRNRIIIGGKVSWVSLPISHRSKFQTIEETRLSNTLHWQKKLKRTFLQSYGHHPHFISAQEIVEALCSNLLLPLGELNKLVIQFIASKLKINPQTYSSSDLDSTNVRSGRLIGLCKHFEAEEYLSPVGSAEYLKEDGTFAKSSTRLRFQDYTPHPYPQKNTHNFVSHLSILDVIANLGWDMAIPYVITGKYEN